ncbi:hypothetical protein ABZ722_31935 [Streptomyces longwoodensis]|uniref:hypothetical protein n=1 Tax=Streptomyces longwoodensis TaxID=68231 RepID=UPI0033F7BB48
MELLRHRLGQLEHGAQPSGGSPLAPAPEQAPAPDATPAVSPATSGPAMNPPSHGTPEAPDGEDDGGSTGRG